MWPKLFAAAAEKLSFAGREICSATNQALANAHHLSPCSLNFAREPNDFGQHTGVLADYQTSLALRHRLVRIDPTNAQWRYDEACILDQMGCEYRKLGRKPSQLFGDQEGIAAPAYVQHSLSR
jgi:hypothetical protein